VHQLFITRVHSVEHLDQCQRTWGPAEAVSPLSISASTRLPPTKQTGFRPQPARSETTTPVSIFWALRTEALKHDETLHQSASPVRVHRKLMRSGPALAANERVATRSESFSRSVSKSATGRLPRLTLFAQCGGWQTRRSPRRSTLGPDREGEQPANSRRSRFSFIAVIRQCERES
jgi:hypothetical protein